MNKDRRKALHQLELRAEELKAALEALMEEVETLRDEEQEYLDNMPDSFRDSEKGELAEAAVNAMEEARSTLETAADSVDEALTNLQSAQE